MGECPGWALQGVSPQSLGLGTPGSLTVVVGLGTAGSLTAVSEGGHSRQSLRVVWVGRGAGGSNSRVRTYANR